MVRATFTWPIRLVAAPAGAAVLVLLTIPAALLLPAPVSAILLAAGCAAFRRRDLR